MAITEQVQCDSCGKQKQQTNHWWMVAKGASGGIELLKFDPNSVGVNHYCGHECLIKAVNEWMQSR